MPLISLGGITYRRLFINFECIGYGAAHGAYKHKKNMAVKTGYFFNNFFNAH